MTTRGVYRDRVGAAEGVTLALMTDPMAAAETTICPSCAAHNERGRKFCGECGTRLAVTCPACGTMNSAGVRFCGECGGALSTEAAAGPVAAPSMPVPTQAEPVGRDELKLVSVLFADLVGFTAASERRDPEAVRETLTRYFETATTVIERYGGTVEKFIGDAVMAVWGTPVAHEDDAERAVRAALDLVSEVEKLGTDPVAGGLRLRAAVMTGEAAVTLGARNQGLVAGDLVNSASRLQGLAEPGTVMVDDVTAHAAGAAVAFEPAGEHELRGRSQPLRALRAMRVVGKRGGVGRSEILEAPFVGRDGELRLVRDLYHAVARERRATLVSIIGQAGIGKSRLLWEFSKYTDGLAEDLYWHEGRSPAYGEGVTFWALGEMIRQRARILEGEDPEATRAKLSDAVARFVADEAERRWVERALRQLLGVQEGAAFEREELFGAWRTFFERLAEESPTVLVFEDVHWADAGLLDFIEHLLEWSRNHAIYVVTMARPELLERRPTWGAGQRNFTSISLEPLPDDAMRQLLEGLVPGLPRGVVQSILDRAGGVPLYAVETVRMLLHQGRLEPSESGGYRPTGELAQIEVPDSLQALISARLDALESADRSLLQGAAVLGQTFPLTALSAVTGVPVQELEPRLRGLTRREILQVDTDPRSPERGHYGFVQALIREVAYSTLPKRERRQRHLAAARYFEGQGDDELAGVLARHYLAAYHAAAGPEADALAAQARVALRAAAERATSLGSFEQARTYLEQALAVAVDEREKAEIYERLSSAADASGLLDEAERRLSQALELYRTPETRPDAARVTAARVGALMRSGRIAAAREAILPAVSEFDDLAGTPQWIDLRLSLAMSILDEEPAEALAHADQSLAAAEELDILPTLVDAFQARAAALILLHRTREAKALLVGAVSMAEANGLPRDRLRATVSLTFMEVAADPRSGLEVGRTGIELASRLGLRRFVFDILGNVARSAFRVGEWDWALAALDDAFLLEPQGFNDFELSDEKLVMLALRGQDTREGMARTSELAATFDDPQAVAWHGLATAWVAFADGRLEEALELAERAARTTEFYAPEAHPLAGRAAYRLGDADRLGRSLSALEKSGARGLAVNADRITMSAGVAALRGGPREAQLLYHDAAERWRELGLDWDLALCLDDYARAFPDQAGTAEAAAEAIAIFERLGASTMLAGARPDGLPAHPPETANGAERRRSPADQLGAVSRGGGA
jgi:class 3 adenylate cyclase/tetratricopeptide (TPR) repeat protein